MAVIYYIITVCSPYVDLDNLPCSTSSINVHTICLKKHILMSLVLNTELVFSSVLSLKRDVTNVTLLIRI